MANLDLSKIKQDYERDGFVSGLELVNPKVATGHRRALEDAEATLGALHYKSKIHTILRSPLELSTLSSVLDIVEQLIGPDILLYNATYIVKEPMSDAHVSWHQDLTYWGLSQDDQVSMWFALSPATKDSGCMRMIPGSHLQGCRDHHPTDDDSNVLFQGQTVREVEDEHAVLCSLQPGEASFHHGWTLHDSLPNRSDDRRIGLNVQYLAPHVKQTKHHNDSAMLVRGRDDYKHFLTDIPADTDLDPAAIARQAELEKRYLQIAGQA